MKRALYPLLIALMAAPAHAAPLNPDDWETIPNAAPPEGCFTFNNGILFATGNTSGKELFYKVEEGKKLMLNGSGLSITLQFDNSPFLAATGAEFQILFHTDNSIREGGGEDILHTVYIRSDGQLNIYDSCSNSMDDYYPLTENSLTTITVNYFIEDNELHYQYDFNGQTSREYVFQEQKVNPNLEWRPSLGLSFSDDNVFRVTDVTFKLVPEPTTTSLSMLALAGLAARKRRK